VQESTETQIGGAREGGHGIAGSIVHQPDDSAGKHGARHTGGKDVSVRGDLDRSALADKPGPTRARPAHQTSYAGEDDEPDRRPRLLVMPLMEEHGFKLVAIQMLRQVGRDVDPRLRQAGHQRCAKPGDEADRLAEDEGGACQVVQRASQSRMPECLDGDGPRDEGGYHEQREQHERLYREHPHSL